MRNRLLAIVIPAYKEEYLDATLLSLVNQSCKDFNVYIGIDASPFDLEDIIRRYDGQLSMVVKRFGKNLGACNIVKHWHRCIDMTQEEPWIWLFSDDDIMGERCVELFYKNIQGAPIFDIYHFDTKIIDSESRIVMDSTCYPEVIDPITFYKKKCRGKIDSFVVENVFSRKVFNNIGGFVDFDMAWWSDTATWMLMSINTGMRTVNGDFVYWRRSNQNITPNNNTLMVERKLFATLSMFEWVNEYFQSNLRIFNHYAFGLTLFYYVEFLDKRQIVGILNKARMKNIISNIEFSFYKLSINLMKSLRKTIR